LRRIIHHQGIEMSQSLSIRFQEPKDITGPTKDLFAELMVPSNTGQSGSRRDIIDTVELPLSNEGYSLSIRNKRYELRRLEKERALKTVDGTATWIITDSICFNPALGERVNNSIVGEGIGKGRIIYGPHGFSLAPGYYMAIVEFKITNMLEAKRVRVTGEVILNNQRYLSQQNKFLFFKGSYVFRLPFKIREEALLNYLSPTIEVRLNIKGLIGVTVDQVAVVYKAASLPNFFIHPGAHLRSAANGAVRWLGKIVKTRSGGRHNPANS
jgi:hypothetical protein